jgi:hypothetical protein
LRFVGLIIPVAREDAIAARGLEGDAEAADGAEEANEP